eukprot:superscaffoldBa00004023_g18124
MLAEKADCWRSGRTLVERADCLGTGWVLVRAANGWGSSRALARELLAETANSSGTSLASVVVLSSGDSVALGSREALGSVEVLGSGEVYGTEQQRLYGTGQWTGAGQQRKLTASGTIMTTLSSGGS